MRTWKKTTELTVTGNLFANAMRLINAAFTMLGLKAAQGGAVTIQGGESTTAANAGGVAKLLGGTPGATGVGGKAQITGGAGGTTSGAGGTADVTGGAGTAGNSTGGAANVTGGAGQGTAAGAAVNVTGGASGAGATGNGGAVNVTGGAAASTNGSGGSVVITPGAKTGTGTVGGIRLEGLRIFKQAAPAAKTTAVTLTAAEVLGGLITANQGGGAAANYQMCDNAALDAALPADFAVDDAFEFSIVNISTVAAEDITLTTNTGITLVGGMVVNSNDAGTSISTGTFRVRKTGASAYSVYRVN